MIYTPPRCSCSGDPGSRQVESFRPEHGVAYFTSLCDMDLITSLEHGLFIVGTTLGIVFLFVLTFFPYLILAREKPKRMEQCTKCGKWSKV